METQTDVKVDEDSLPDDMDEQEDEQNGDATGEGAGRERSTIVFPYAPLEDAVPVARVLHDRGGGSGSMSQVAAWLGHDSIKSGAFRTKLGSARIFGLIRIDRAGVSLTEIGRQIVDPTSNDRAKVKAFLNVPLYKKTFEKYDGYALPPDAGLEAEFVRLGVSEKQKARARQVFQRSAKQAGFFSISRNKLVMPTFQNASITISAEPESKPEEPDNNRTAKPEKDHKPHPLIAALFETVPEEGAPWDYDAREKWLSTAKSIFDLVYRD